MAQLLNESNEELNNLNHNTRDPNETPHRLWLQSTTMIVAVVAKESTG
jgi:hypothetical protein